MHGPINAKSPNNNNTKWQMGFNSAFKGLRGERVSFILEKWSPLFTEEYIEWAPDPHWKPWRRERVSVSGIEAQ
jgi:hypothetical protein